MLCIREALKRLRENQNISVSLYHCDDFFISLAKGKKTDISCRPCQNRHLFSISCTYAFLRAYYELRRSSEHRSGLCKAFFIKISKLHTQKFLVSSSNSTLIISLLNTQRLWPCLTWGEVSWNRRE